MVADPAGAGLVGDPRVFGVTTDVPPDDQLAIILGALPGARRIGMLYQSSSEASAATVAGARAAMSADRSLHAEDLAAHASIAEAINALLAAGVDVVWAIPDRQVYTPETIKALLLAALRKKVPVFGFSAQMVKAGALLGTGLDPKTQGVQAAELLTSRLLEGDTPDAAPVPPRYQVIVNALVADKIGVSLPDAFMGRADVVEAGSEK